MADTSEDPRRSPVEKVRTEPVPKTGNIIVCLLGGFDGCAVHYDEGKTKPHACSYSNTCPPSIHKLPLQWRGYAPACWFDQKREIWIACVFEATEALFEIMDEFTDLRGTEWDCTRHVNSEGKQEVTGVYRNNIEEAYLLPKFDVHPFVEKMYRKSDMKWRVRPFFVKRLALPPVAMPAPAGFKGKRQKKDEDIRNRAEVSRMMKEHLAKLDRGEADPGDTVVD